MLEILYQDEYLVAVNKPAGMLVHRSWLDAHETQF
ncbi:MAG: tRNA pseudouridine(65) synthase TruC, partial [Haemophilus parainfluenzae]|nr:tRNA pseudouridine(65) synthase TruC [Haemophilus parainfluenzae]